MSAQREVPMSLDTSNYCPHGEQDDDHCQDVGERALALRDGPCLIQPQPLSRASTARTTSRQLAEDLTVVAAERVLSLAMTMAIPKAKVRVKVTRQPMVKPTLWSPLPK
jgi:hypothetical protein